MNPAANAECGAMASQTFGKNVFSSTYDPAVFGGWDVRAHDWNFGLSIQQQVLPRVSVLAAYNWRWFANFFVTDNRAVTAADFGTFSITAPTDARLPNGGSVISGLNDVNANKFGQVDNYITKASNYGNQTQNWRGLDLSANVRLGAGVTFQGGFSTGRTLTDNCEIVAALPEILVNGTTITPAQYCHIEDPYRTQVKGLWSYTVPKIAVQVSGTFQSSPGARLAANYNVANAIIAPSLGRNLSGGANATINLVTPATLYGDRINQIDLRASKILKFGRMRSQISLDLYNVTNSDATQTYNQTFVLNGAWLTPTLILPARFAKITAQIDF